MFLSNTIYNLLKNAGRGAILLSLSNFMLPLSMKKAALLPTGAASFFENFYFSKFHMLGNLLNDFQFALRGFIEQF